MTLGIDTEVKAKDPARQAPNDGSKAKPQVIVRDLKKGDERIDTLATGIVAVNTEKKSPQDFIDEFKKIVSIGESAVDPITVKNTVETEWVVDPARTYYLNAKLPWFGSGNLTQELNPDGTLSKAISNPDTKLAEGLSALLPIKEFVTSKVVKSGVEAAADPATKSDFAAKLQGLQSDLLKFSLVKGGKPPPPPTPQQTEYTITLTLTTEEIGNEYTLTKAPARERPSSAAKIEFSEMADQKAYFVVKAIEDKSDEKKEGGPKIGLSGSIDLPKDWGKAK